MDDKRRHKNDDESNEKEIETIDQLIDHILGIFDDAMKKSSRSVIHGFTIIDQPGKDPKIFGFGGRKPVKQYDEEESEGNFYIQKQDPLIEVQQTGDKVHLIADLGVDEDCIEYFISDMQVEINVIIEGEGQSKIIRLPTRVDPATAGSTCINGVLEIILDYPE
ncbi:MAG: hypothetical protein JW705_02425 [Methanosarcinaceae archaeon]|nr:hypothetical protein [Methanosarcinaceae archaeon]